MTHAAYEDLLTDNTVWILGAGASYDCISWKETPCGVPLTANLIPLEEHTERIGIPLVVPIRSNLQRLIDRRLLSSVSVEEAVGKRIEITMDELRGLRSHADEGQDAGVSYRALVTTIAVNVSAAQSNVFLGGAQEGEMIFPMTYLRADCYLWLTAVAWKTRYWSILTLNYDELLDYGFRLIPRGLLYRLPQQYDVWLRIADSARSNRRDIVVNHGVYLKLHGSLDMFSCANEQCRLHTIPYRVKRRKTEFVVRVAELLKEAIKEAPDAGRRIVIVDPNAGTIADRLCGALSTKCEAIASGFGEFIQDMWDWTHIRPSFIPRRIT